MKLDTSPYTAARGMVPRLFRCMYRQQSRTQSCPDLPRLEGKTVLVTGGASGVGEFISRGALARGAKVISLSRGVSKSKGALENVQQIKCDLADLSSVRDAVAHLDGTKIDILFCNAGVVMRDKKMVTDEIEMTYAINVLGHHLLYRLLMNRGAFASKPSIVITSGDAYVGASECVPNPKKFGMNSVYGGSKLGNMWQAFELTKRFPDIHTTVVHPGAIMSGLGDMNPKGLALWALKRMAISEEQGAQASLIAATQNLPSGTYWHNVCGVMALPVGDTVLNAQKSTALWDKLETFCSDYL